MAALNEQRYLCGDTWSMVIRHIVPKAVEGFGAAWSQLDQGDVSDVPDVAREGI
jgi:hypothetical protein